jgi:hypothetical protein
LLCKKITVPKSKEVKARCNLAESSKEGCGSKKGCFAAADVYIITLFRHFT